MLSAPSSLAYQKQAVTTHAIRLQRCLRTADSAITPGEVCQPLPAACVMNPVERAPGSVGAGKSVSPPVSPIPCRHSCPAIVTRRCLQPCRSAPVSACRRKGRRSWPCRDRGGLSNSSASTTRSAGPTPGARSARRRLQARWSIRRPPAPSWEPQSAPRWVRQSMAPAALRLVPGSASWPAASAVPRPEMPRVTPCSSVTTRVTCSACTGVATRCRSSAATLCEAAMALRRQG